MPLALLLALACHRVPDHPPTLRELQTGEQVDDSGRWLMSLPPGLARLDDASTSRPLAIIGVHGYKSEGKEWVEALQRFGQMGAEVYFYRWNWNQCPETASEELSRAMEGLARSRPHLERLVVVAHSYGGVVATVAAQDEPFGKPAELHVVASPLAGVSQLERCDFHGVPAKPASEDISWRQWRTRKEVDGVYKDMETDPQIVELPALAVTDLPATWEGRELGHNWSVLYVAKSLETAQAP